MKVILDTNALIRYFTHDNPEMAQKVKVLFEREKEICIPDVVFPEIEYVLSELYDVDRETLVQIFKFLISRSNISINFYVKQAVSLFESTKLDMADCIIGTNSTNGTLASFDKKLLRDSGVKAYWK